VFTGLIRERGRIVADPEAWHGGLRLGIEHSRELAEGLEVGASLAVAGVCLTVTRLDQAGSDHRRSWVEIAPETEARTTLGRLRAGDEVNLEPSLRLGEPLGGHLVQGHVDGTAVVLEREDLAEHRRLAIALPSELVLFTVVKGSIAVDGVSLTIAALPASGAARFEVALIPHTLAVTTLGALVPHDPVNLEVDVLGKYVARMLAARGLGPEAAAPETTPW
jgi:riboflavin synthase